MYRKNILFIIIIFIILIIYLACASNVGDVDTANEVTQRDIILKTFDYPLPIGIIEDVDEKEAMIEAKIKHILSNNVLFWGDLPGTKEEILKVFSDVSGFIDRKFPAFKGLDLDWDEFIKNCYRGIEKAENYGNFAYIMTLMGFVLQEGHTQILPSRLINDKEVRFLLNHAPIIITQPYSRIGACYTVTENEELVISKLFEYDKNPYNFKPGDEIIGFNGIPWHEWVYRLIDAGIPIFASPGGTKSAIRYNLLKSGMANINLFEKVNIKRRETGQIDTMDVVYLKPEGNLVNCTDLTQAEGIGNWKNSNFIYGILEGTNIGYIYLRRCIDGFDEFPVDDWNPYETEFAYKFEKAILELIDTDGIIIDIRSNSGGRPEPLFRGLSHLIKSNEDIYLFGAVERDPLSPNKEKLKKISNYPWSPLKADVPDLYYENPIIVMTGPDCISACDMLVALMSRYDEFTIIGKNPNGSAVEIDNINGRNFLISEEYENEYIKTYLTTRTFCFRDEPENYLMRREDFLDMPIWFTKHDLENDIDTIRKYAIKLIKEAHSENN